jgi:WD40 repeat protein
MFSDAQEADLGDVMSESVEQHVNVLDDAALNEHLRSLGEKLVRYLPANNFRFQFVLVDIPDANALSLPGGRVYVSRKLVAFLRNDDELAGVLAHELGHIVTHQSAIEMTHSFRSVLHVNQVEDRADISARFHQVLDAWQRGRSNSIHKEDSEQQVADRVGLYATARAGFSGQSWVDALDRLQDTQGKTGNWVADFFGSTKPEQRRLREALRAFSGMPPACFDSTAKAQPQDFDRWKAEVIKFSAGSRRESIPGLVSKQPLASPLRPDISHLRFSPDGKFLLAQDDGGIHVLSRDPLKFLFFIDAPDAHKAGFSPDSRSVVFYLPSLRVEVWDIATQKLSSVNELVLRKACLQSSLSPEGSVLACIDEDLSLTLLQVATGQRIVTKVGFVPEDWITFMAVLAARLQVAEGSLALASFGFSPDGEYFLASARGNTLAFNLRTQREISVPGSIRNAMQVSFAFIGNDRIVGVDAGSPEKSPILKFPSGERLRTFPLAARVQLAPITHGEGFLVSPLKEDPLGVVDLTRNGLAKIKRDAADVYDGGLVAELNDGEIALRELGSDKPLGGVHLKQAYLGGVKSFAVSSDLQWMAMSGRVRGAVWDLNHNIRTAYVRGFRGVWFSPDHSALVDFPEKDKQERALVHLDPQGHLDIVRKLDKEKGKQDGPFLVIDKPQRENKPSDANRIFEIRDLASERLVWSRLFDHGLPHITLNPIAGTALLGALCSSPWAQEELKRFPDLKKSGSSEDYLLEKVDMEKNAVVGKLIVHTNKGSIRIKEAWSDGDWVALLLAGNRIVVYSLSAAEEKGHVFGSAPEISAAAGLVAVAAGSNDLNVYELATMKLRSHYKFPTGVAIKNFSHDGKRLFVMTRDQIAYVVDPSVGATVAGVTAQN